MDLLDQRFTPHRPQRAYLSNSQKKIVARLKNRDWVSGYLPGVGFADGGRIQVLELNGRICDLALPDVKWICFLRDFASGDPLDPEKQMRRFFGGRPRTPGLWLRLRLVDGDELEAMASNDVSLLDPAGLSVTPADARSNIQRIFIPHSSIRRLEVLSVVGTVAPKTVKQPRPEKEDRQESLF